MNVVYAKFVVVDSIGLVNNTGSFYVDGLAAIPEPSTVAMMVMGGLGR